MCIFAVVKFTAVKEWSMKKFYDRQQEMNQLLDMQRQAFEDYSRFVVLTGRRRVGKTSLVIRLMDKRSWNLDGLLLYDVLLRGPKANIRRGGPMDPLDLFCVLSEEW